MNSHRLPKQKSIVLQEKSYSSKLLTTFNKVKTYGDVPWYDKVVNPGDEDLYKARDPRTFGSRQYAERY